ncbi:MAG: protein-export chaperone SecB [Magnetospirillum sp. WYHS-4]
MSDRTDTPTDVQAAQPPLAVAGQYIKDLSFEVPGAPGIFGQMQKQQPDIAVNVDVNAHGLQEKLFEVVLNVRAECKVGETVAFIAELSYGGLFTLNVAREHLEPMLLIECPRLLFPFARNILADLTRDGGFPPLMLGMVDFVGMYQNQLREREKAVGEPVGNA